MTNQQSQLTGLVLPENNKTSDDNSNVIKTYLYHWPLFVLSILIALAAAFFYLKIASPVYPITATVKFKAPPSTSKSSSINDLDQTSNPLVVQNELEVMQSKKLLDQVVRGRNLWVNYFEKQGLLKTDLYNKAPVNFNFIDTNINYDPEGQKFEILIKDARSFLMKDETGVEKTFNFLSPVKSTFGTWQLTATPETKKYIGSKILIAFKDPEVVSDNYQKNIKVEFESKDAQIVSLSTTDAIPARGKDILNSLIASYMFYAQHEKNEQTQKVQLYLNAKVDSLKQELDDLEKNLAKFKGGKGISNLDDQAQNYRNTNQSNAGAINDANVKLSVLESLEKYANSPSNSAKLPAVTNLDDGTLVTLYNKLADLQLERQQKLSITPESNPLFASLDMQINTLKNDIKEKITTIKSGLLANKNQFQSFDNNVKSSLNTLPYQEKEYNALKREQENKESLYKFLSARREEVNLQFASLIQEAEIVDDAHAGEKKWPKSSVVYVLALVLGCSVAAGILYLRENLNERVKSRKQIEEEIAAPILGEISYLATDDPIVVSPGRSKFAIGEQFRALRTNLYYLLGNNQRGRVTLFTSSVSGEGKSFISANLAVTLAYASRKTIILEMDLRRPGVHSLFGLSNEIPGISNYLAGESSNYDEMIVPSGIKGLDVLLCGTILPNPTELLESTRLDELINSLKQKYDDIIIDTPPIQLITDATIIARVADASVYVVRQNYTHKNELRFIRETNASKRFNKFSIVFNGVKKDVTSYAYSYSNYDKYNSFMDNDKGTIGSNVKRLLDKF